MALGGVLGSVLVAGGAGDAAALCVAGVALGDIHLRFTWQARHLATSTFVLRGRPALMALGGALGSVLVAGDAGDAAALCVVGVANMIFLSSQTHTSLAHTPSFTHNSVTHTHDLSSSHAIFHIALNHTQLF